MNSSFRRLIDNKDIHPGNHVTIYKTPEIKTQKKIHKVVLDGFKDKKKLKLNHVKI